MTSSIAFNMSMIAFPNGSPPVLDADAFICPASDHNRISGEIVLLRKKMIKKPYNFLRSGGAAEHPALYKTFKNKYDTNVRRFYYAEKEKSRRTGCEQRTEEE